MRKIRYRGKSVKTGEPVSDDLMRAVNDYVLNARKGYPRVMDETDMFIHNAFKAGSRWQKQQIIDKACMYLNEHREGFITDDYIKDFRKALEEG